MPRKPSYEDLERELARLKCEIQERERVEANLEGELAKLRALHDAALSQSDGLLRESEERFRFMVETTGDVIYRLHYDTMRYDYLSPGIQKLTGYQPEEIMDAGFSRLVTRIDLPGKENVDPDVLVRDRRAGKTGEYRGDYLIVTRDGGRKWLRDHSFPWYDGSGRLVGSVGILSDVSEYREADALVRQRTADLMESEEKYRTLVENVPLVVYRMKPTGELLFINQFIEELVGFSPADMVEDPALWTGAISGEDRARVVDLRQKTRKEGKELLVEYRMVHRNGSIVYVVDHAIPSRTPEGGVGTVDGIMMDVTGRVKLQERLIRSEGIKTIGEVSARLAHEIRNPLVSAGGFARRLLSSMPPSDPNRDKVEIIVKEVSRLEGILRMILNYIQPIELDISSADPYTLVETALRGIEPDIREKAIRIRTDLPSGLPHIPVDQLQMKQVLKSLLKKALSQMVPGDTLVVASALEKDVLELIVQYPVRNLSPEDVDHFFYPFTTSKVDYPAADLPMSKIIVHKHGGEIEVVQKPPGQISIRIALPVQQRFSPAANR